MMRRSSFYGYIEVSHEQTHGMRRPGSVRPELLESGRPSESVRFQKFYHLSPSCAVAASSRKANAELRVMSYGCGSY
jgi:hypothetical protein